MFRGIVRKEGDGVVIEISPTSPEVARLEDNQEVSVSIHPEPQREMSDEEFEAMVIRLIVEHREALDYLADH